MVGPRATNILAAAIEPRLGTAGPRGYNLRAALTKPARLTVRLYRSSKSPPSLTAHASAPAGDSTVRTRRPRSLTPGVYAVDLRADANGQTTRTVQYAYLGGRLTTKVVRAGEGRIAQTADEDPTDHITRCHRFSQRRIDCVIVVSVDTPDPGRCSGVSSYQLARNGQIAVRGYSCPRRRNTSTFKRHPRWQPGRAWFDLSAYWR